MWDRVQDWRERLRVAELPSLGLSVEGAAHAWAAALDSLDDNALSAASQVPGRPYASAGFIAASTVFTAPLEWCALLLGHGTPVALKLASAHADLVPVLQRTANAAGLPLSVSIDSEAAKSADLLIAMGSDATVRALERERSGRPFLGFGHRFSAAWIERAWEAIAQDLIVHDGYGCMSPVLIATPLPLDEAVDRMAEALATWSARIPLGQVAPADLAGIRSRQALARVVGRVASGTGWSVHGLPSKHWTPMALPRSIAVCSVASRADAWAMLAAHEPHLSTVADAEGHAWGSARVVLPGHMQRPPLDRVHDGVPVLSAVLRTTD